jgi:hypothetical protein
LLVTNEPAPLLVISYGIALTALGFLNPLWDTTVQQAVPPAVLARVMAYDWVVSLAAQPLGFALAPAAAAAWSPIVPLLFAAVLVAVSCLGTALVPGVRNLRIGDATEVPPRRLDKHPALGSDSTTPGRRS